MFPSCGTIKNRCFPVAEQLKSAVDVILEYRNKKTLCLRCDKFIFNKRMEAHKQTCKGELDSGKRLYKKREYKERGAYKKNKQAEKQEEKRQEQTPQRQVKA